MLSQLDKGENIIVQKAMQSAHKHFSNNNYLTSCDIKYIKKKLDFGLESKYYDGVRHIVFTLDSPPSIMTSGVLGLTFDFQGKLIQKMSNDLQKIPDYLFINSFSSHGVGYIVLSWLEEHDSSCMKFYESLLETESINDAVVLFIFAMLENIYLSEKWWSNLSQIYRDELMNAFSQGVIDHTYNDVLSTKSRFGAFEITKITTLNFRHATL